MKRMSIDIETFSGADLNDVGVYKYVEDPLFDILLFSVSIDGGPVKCYDLASGDAIPKEIIEALTDPTIEKHAYNAQFERICLSRYLGLPTGKYLDPNGWHCDMVLAATAGLPLSLDAAGSALEVTKKKLKEDRDLVSFFCKPIKSQEQLEKDKQLSFDFMENRRKPEDYPEKWAKFKEYNIRDVEAEMEIESKIGLTLSKSEYENYVIDQRINDSGVLIDLELCKKAIEADARYMSELTETLKYLTGLDNPKSVQQFQPWLNNELVKHNLSPVHDVQKGTIDRLIKNEKVPDDLKQILKFKKTLGKTSTVKFQRMIGCACKDGRARGLFQFYGANRTGRFAGKLIQLQNLTKNKAPNILEIREALKKDGYDGLAKYGDVSDLLSQLVRSAIIPAPGKVFIDVDYSAIEARVLAWLANETWRLEAFANGKDIYCESASQMFKVPVEKHGQNKELRAKGKVAELACIAEGSLVLTDKGLIPIEQITTDMKVWDGFNWVEHKGIIYKGEREVFEYDGLTATPEHRVWCFGEEEPIPFELAIKNKKSLVKTGNFEQRSRSCQTQKEKLERNTKKVRVYDIRDCGPYHRFTVSNCLVHNCGYGGALGAMRKMGGEDMGLKDEEMSKIVKDWRKASPNIVKFWWNVDGAIKDRLTNLNKSYEGTPLKPEEVQQLQKITTLRGAGNCKTGIAILSSFLKPKNYEKPEIFENELLIRLPSGRNLLYPDIKLKPGSYCNSQGEMIPTEGIAFKGIDEKNRWGDIESYGPKFVENITQATARDLLCNSMKLLGLADFNVVMHIHDEAVIEAPIERCREALKVVEKIMSMTPDWAEGLIVNADGYLCPCFLKDGFDDTEFQKHLDLLEAESANKNTKDSSDRDFL